MNRKQIRIKIHDLLDKHGESFYRCKGCSICTELKGLREPLVRDPAEKFKHILAKGQDMTKSDIALLLENEVKRQDIRKAIGIDNNVFYSMMKNYGFSKEMPQRGRGNEEMAKINLKKYKDLKGQGFSDIEIAQKVEMNPQYLKQLKKKWYQEEEEALKAAKEVPETNTIPEDKTAEFEQLITDLKEKLAEKDEMIRQRNKANTGLNEIIGQLHNRVRELENLHDACEDVESELDSVRKENRVLKKRVEELESAPLPVISPLQCDCEVKVNHLQEENQAMRQLLKLWM